MSSYASPINYWLLFVGLTIAFTWGMVFVCYIVRKVHRHHRTEQYKRRGMASKPDVVIRPLRHRVAKFEEISDADYRPLP